ncbi:NAT_SF domain containing protein [Burkholderiales bacterium]
MTLRIQAIDLDHACDTEALVDLLDLYARGPTGKGEGLSAEVKHSLPTVLRGMPHYRGWIARRGDLPVGLLNAFIGLSTFRAQRLMNVHDLCVRPGLERQGIGSQLLASAEAWARSEGLCKLTLEVLEHHTSAVSAYERAGFRAYQLAPELGRAIFFEKILHS